MLKISLLLWTLWNAGSVAVNTALFVDAGRPISLAAAVFCGLMFCVSAAWYVAEVRR